jgi:subtilisin family serine protease
VIAKMKAAAVVAVALVVVLATAGAATAAAPPRTPHPSIRLPGDVRGAAARSTSWIVGAAPGRAATAIAERHGARALEVGGTYVVARDRARSLAADLRRAGLLRQAEPDVVGHVSSAFDATPFGWARGSIVAPTLLPPAPTAQIGILDTYVDDTHPDLAGHVQHLPGPATGVTHPHGTMVSSVAAGAYNGFGVTGIFPGAQIVNYGVTPDLHCSDSVDGITALAAAHVAVIVASYGFTEPCYAEYAAIALAYGEGTMLVAAAGNEFQEGNPISFPAAWPHVLSVAATNQQNGSSYFSSANASIDVAAPGENVPLAIPGALDTTDGTPDGVTLASGTSFAAPIVAGAVAWLRSARPQISNGQAADLLRHTAIDIDKKGWDQNSGYGLVNLEASLAAPVPASDPMEPNDSIAEIDGTVFRNPDEPVWSGGARKRIPASVDSVEDPIDVYRVRIPARTRWRALVRPRTRAGDPDLQVLRGAATSLSQRRFDAGHSDRGAGRTDAVTLTNREATARSMDVVVYVPDEARYADAPYTLELAHMSQR